MKNPHLISEKDRKNWKNETLYPTDVLAQISHKYDTV